jgi:hypothetical protein
MCKFLGEPIEKHLKREAAEALRAEQEKQLTESIIKDIGGINMNGERFVMPKDIDKVIIRTKDGREFEGEVKRSEYTPGPFGRVGYSDLTVRTEAPARTGQFGIKNVIFNNPATIVYWDDDTRTIVYCNDNVKLVKKVVDGKEIEVAKPMKAETYSEEVGLAMAIAKKHYGNSGAYNNIFREYIPGMKEREKAAKKERKAAKREVEHEQMQ